MRVENKAHTSWILNTGRNLNYSVILSFHFISPQVFLKKQMNKQLMYTGSSKLGSLIEFPFEIAILIV